MGVGSSTKRHWNDEIIAIREDKKEIINNLKNTNLNAEILKQIQELKEEISELTKEINEEKNSFDEAVKESPQFKSKILKIPDYKLMIDYINELSNIVLEINKTQQEAEEKARQKAKDELLKIEIKEDKNIYQGNRIKLIIFGVDFEKRSLFYKDNCIVENYKIFLDIYTPQLSTFNAYNYYNLNVEIEDIVCILNNENQLYIGIITHIEKNKDENLYTFTTKNIESIFDFKIYNIYKNKSWYIFSTLKEIFNKNLSFIKLNKKINDEKNNNPKFFEENEEIEFNFYQFINKIFKITNIFLKFNIDLKNFILNCDVCKDGQEDIKLNIYKVKDNIKCITNIEIEELNQKRVNRIDFYQKNNPNNYIKSSLLKNNTISYEINNNNLQNNLIKNKIYELEEKDFTIEKIITISNQEFKLSEYSHLIKFDITKDNNILNLNNLQLRDKFTLLFNNKEYNSILSGIILESNKNTITLIFGQVRLWSKF
ncbi:hypothetical protein SKUN_001513 [Spiroplasma kunkelii CR2-3x]|uniref:Uncharacterized protein n=1 Tax=Spiroplasma kunkelii CR2-3x TaxID=273035 RepID=A0A0K2JJG2_SPIKU|nr:hypothetical protein [Spiroplasma kunkelii]ALA98371.1 hypothetical protein SKUN_001513 [Spiroplasma kunkelii CR2-3x]